MTPGAKQSTLSRAELEDRMRGCLFGNAIGDAYGLSTEFLSKERARQLYGNGPILFGDDDGYPFYLDGHRARWEVNDFTDDTDQLLVILQSLEQTRDGTLHPINLARKLKEWSEIGHPENNTPPRGIGFTVGSVMSHPRFTTHPYIAAYDIWDHHRRDLAPNGAVMRTSILGLESFWDEETVVKNALAGAKVTHADPRSIISALLASVLISRILRGGGRDVAQDRARCWNAQFGNEATKSQYREHLLEYLLYGSEERGESFRTKGYYNILLGPDGNGAARLDGFVPKDVNALLAEFEVRSKKEAAEREEKIERLKRGRELHRQKQEQHQHQQQQSSGSGGSFLQQLKDTFKPSSSKKSHTSVYDEIAEWNRQRPAVTLREDIGWCGIDRVGADEAMTQLTRSVLDDYGFLVRETELVPRRKATAETAEDVRVQDRWYGELEAHLYPRDLDSLELGHAAKIGYALKCIGSGWYAVTRQEDPQATQEAYQGAQGLFRGCLEQVTLEAGDADTNCAVVGSLLGARFGLQQGVPVKWYQGIEHRDWLNETFDRYIARVLDAYEVAVAQQQ